MESSDAGLHVDPRSSVLDRRYLLASRSPRRLELLASIVPREQIRVVPPTSADEAGFESLHSLAAIEKRLLEIARDKCRDVQGQINGEDAPSVIIAADTVIVVGHRDGEYVVLGQPPEPDWQPTVRHWFCQHYAGRSHWALTGLCVAAQDVRHEMIVSTQVTFRPDVDQHLDWYLATGEPRGKAGGYAIQGAGSIFVDRIEGSLTNVIGLPLRELLDMLHSLGDTPA